MEIKDILEKCDHTLLRVDCTSEEIRKLCDQAIQYHCASVCIPPAHIPGAKRYVGDKLRLCTVIGFPNGYNTSAVKAFEAADAIKNGADEIDMVINLTDLKDGRFDEILNEINEIKKCCDGRTLKVIVETCFLSEDEKVKMCKVVSNSGADFIKTSTGFGTGGATKHDVELFAKHISNGKLIKAAGGIADLKDAEDFIALGASRLGTSRIVKLIKQGGENKNEKLSDSSY